MPDCKCNRSGIREYQHEQEQKFPIIISIIHNHSHVNPRLVRAVDVFHCANESEVWPIINNSLLYSNAFDEPSYHISINISRRPNTLDSSSLDSRHAYQNPL